MSSSLVGMTQTCRLESGVEISRGSSERTAFLSSSILTPIQARRFTTYLRMRAEFSPTPAVKTMVSTPFMAWTIVANWEATR